MPEILNPEDIAIEDRQDEIEQISPSALAILNQSEHAAMVQTANYGNNRRKLVEFDSKLRSYANHSQPIALSMFYSLPRAGKQIIGPSVRFAEIVAPCWKNCAVASRAIGDSASTVTAQGIFIDYEANLRNSIEVPRRITDKDGKRYGDDMIVTTINAAMSVARRNAVLKGGVPQALWTPAYLDAQLTAVGKAMSHSQRVAEAMEYLQKLGVTEWQILNSVGVPSPKELETEHLVTLRVLVSEVKRGDKTIEEVFGSPFDKEIDSLFSQLKMNDAQQRMLRNSYMGRAKELVEYLRDRQAPARSTPAAPAPTPIVEKPAPVEVQAAPDVLKEVWPQDVVPESQAEPAEEEPPATDFEFGANAPAPEPPPAPPKRAGRPTKAEQARRAAQQPEPQPMQTEPLQPVDEADDQFAF
jgi:hypothetical protein